MGAAVYVVLDTNLSDIDASSVDGKALARDLEALDRVAAKNGLSSLCNFMSQGAEELLAMAEELGIDPSDAPPERFFPPEDGLRVARAILGSADEEAFDPRTIADLESVIRVLSAAATQGARFRLAVDG